MEQLAVSMQGHASVWRGAGRASIDEDSRARVGEGGPGAEAGGGDCPPLHVWRGAIVVSGGSAHRWRREVLGAQRAIVPELLGIILLLLLIIRWNLRSAHMPAAAGALSRHDKVRWLVVRVLLNCLRIWPDILGELWESGGRVGVLVQQSTQVRIPHVIVDRCCKEGARLCCWLMQSVRLIGIGHLWDPRVRGHSAALSFGLFEPTLTLSPEEAQSQCGMW